jgi:hypothetical protein
MFSSSSQLPSESSRRMATLCSAAVHVAAVGALWATGQAITAPPVPPRELREAVRLVSPPPRVFRPRRQPKARVRRFEMERAASRQTSEAIRVERQAPRVAVWTAPAPILPKEPAIVVTSPTARPAGFAEVARATIARLELEPQAAAFGSALGRPEGPSSSRPAARRVSGPRAWLGRDRRRERSAMAGSEAPKLGARPGEPARPGRRGSVRRSTSWQL